MAALEDSGSGRVIGALVSPVKTFDSIAGRPTWVVPLVILLIISTLVGVLANKRIDPNDMRQSIQQRMEKSGRSATPEQVDQTMTMSAKVSSYVVWLIPVFGGIVYLLVALLFFAAFHFFGGSEISYKTSFAVAVHGYLPGIVAALLSLPVILTHEHLRLKDVQGGNLLASNLGAFAPDSLGPAAHSLLSSVDFFSLWSLCLMVVGYKAAAKVSTANAATVVVVLWALYVAGKAGLTVLFG
jgi:Yip1 domain